MNVKCSIERDQRLVYLHTYKIEAIEENGEQKRTNPLRACSFVLLDFYSNHYNLHILIVI